MRREKWRERQGESTKSCWLWTGCELRRGPLRAILGDTTCASSGWTGLSAASISSPPSGPICTTADGQSPSDRMQ